MDTNHACPNSGKKHQKYGKVFVFVNLGICVINGTQHENRS
jgi:hypothetical protein